MNQKGNVVGVAVQLIPPDKAQNIFFGVKSSTLTTFAKANKVNFLPPNNNKIEVRSMKESCFNNFFQSNSTFSLNLLV